jgi:H+-transporting ATPase
VVFRRAGIIVRMTNPHITEGLTSDEARKRLDHYGPNAVPEEQPRPVLLFLRKFWSPVPWMLEATLILELALGNYSQSVIIFSLLVLNAGLSFAQESRAGKALALLRQRLAIQVRVLRDGRWQTAVAQELVPGDVVHVRVGDLVPADLLLRDGAVLVDQSTLTGEALPAEAGPGKPAYAGSVVRRGEATGEVSATGRRTYYGKTAELVHTASAPSHLERLIFTIVKYLVAVDLLLVAAILVYAVSGGIGWVEILPFALILLVASIPVALPATYTLANAVGSLGLAARGVLVTRLSAVEEAAAMDVLCSDKTGTITKNELAVAALRPHPPGTEVELLRLAALASDESTQDPIDLAILAAAGRQDPPSQRPERLRFVPFDPSTKRSEAIFAENGRVLHVVKGTPVVVAALSRGAAGVDAAVDELAGQGFRVLAVSAGPEGDLQLAGLVAFQDPPREDSQAVVAELENLGVRLVMVTGDNPTTARAVAAQVGIKGDICRADGLLREQATKHLDCAVFAGVFPEDKFHLVQAYQHAGHVVGMTGDGVNDAPALKQAEAGIAVANATDVAKAAASLVLTRPGLAGVLAAVETGRCIHQRMLTYTLNKIIKTLQIALFLSFGLLLFGVFVTTPRHILLLLFANDFVTMSLAADRVTFSAKPDRWDIRSLTLSALVLALAWLAFSFAVFLVARDVLQLDLPRLQTVSFLTLVFSGQATVYLVRERGHLGSSLPGRWLVLSTAVDLLVVGLLAVFGILMAPLTPGFVVGLLAVVLVFVVLLDLLKCGLFRRFALR